MTLLSVSHRSLSLLLLVCCLPSLYSWSTRPLGPAPLQKTRAFRHCCPPSLCASKKDTTDISLHRISIAGASVSPTGFWIVLQVTDNSYWPVQVTSSKEDTASATSIESLTLLQLISGVDMAGPMLPPELLSQLAVLHAENSSNDDVIVKNLLQFLKLPDDADVAYSELNEWQRSKIRLPQITLEGIVVELHRKQNSNCWTLTCASPDIGKFVFSPRIHVKDDDNAIAVAFYSIALALRYRAPLFFQPPLNTTTEENGSFLFYSLDQIKNKFPLYYSVEQLKKPSNRVQSNVQRGFEIHKLTGALRVAMERGDERAASNIRKRLDQFDSMEDLPVLSQFEKSDFDQLQ